MKSPSRTYSVTEVNNIVRETLRINPLLTEGLWVAGEVQNLRVQRLSGHIYFTLSDENCSVKGVFFNGVTRSRGYLPENGRMLRVFGRVDVYVNRGEYQIYVERWEPLLTEGERRLQFLRIRERLAADGLLREQRGARPLPAFPRLIGLITSPGGAAFQDVLRVSWRRFPGTRFILYPAVVQGDQTPLSVLAGLQAIIALASEFPVDVILIVRGGGSLEDLWYFNDEALARAIAASPIPVVTGIGHEIDTSIADLVSDVQAATPSNAAERVVPDRNDLLKLVGRSLQSLQSGVVSIISNKELHLGRVENALRLRSPEKMVLRKQQALLSLFDRLCRALERGYQASLRRLTAVEARLNAVNPERVLRRGFAIVTTEAGALVSSALQPHIGDRLRLLFSDGSLLARVEEEQGNEPPATHSPQNVRREP